MSNHFVTICLSLWIVSIFSGCTHTECTPSGPERTLTLHFRYRDENTPDRLKNEIKAITVYIFSNDGHFISSHQFNRKDIGDQDDHILELLPGDYHLISWGNLTGRTKVTPLNPNRSTLISDFRLSLNATRSNTVYHPTSDSLFYARKNTRLSADTHEITLSYRRESCYFRIIMEQFSRTPEIRMKGMRGSYNMEAAILPEYVQYAPRISYKQSSSTYETSFAILRPANNDQLSIELYEANTNILIYTLDLSAVLDELGIDTEKDDEINILIRLRPLNGNRIAVTVNNWHIIENIDISM